MNIDVSVYRRRTFPVYVRETDAVRGPRRLTIGIRGGGEQVDPPRQKSFDAGGDAVGGHRFNETGHVIEAAAVSCRSPARSA